jgi:hypothetical protein
MPKRKRLHISKAILELEKAANMFGIEVFKQTLNDGTYSHPETVCLESLSLTLLYLGQI